MIITIEQNGVSNKYKCVPITEENSVKVGLVIGHYKGGKGAHSNIFGASEYDFWLKFRDHCNREDILTFDHQWFIHNEKLSSYTDRQTEMANRTRECDLVFELHFNSFNGEAHGSEMLYNDMNDIMEDLASYFGNEMFNTMGVKARRPKPIRLNDDKTENGELFIKLTKGDAAILEPIFGDNEEDCSKFQYSPYAVVLNRLVDRYTSIKQD